MFSSKSLEKPLVTRIFSHLVANSSFCTSGGRLFKVGLCVKVWEWSEFHREYGLNSDVWVIKEFNERPHTLSHHKSIKRRGHPLSSMVIDNSWFCSMVWLQGTLYLSHPWYFKTHGFDPWYCPKAHCNKKDLCFLNKAFKDFWHPTFILLYWVIGLLVLSSFLDMVWEVRLKEPSLSLTPSCDIFTLCMLLYASNVNNFAALVSSSLGIQAIHISAPKIWIKASIYFSYQMKSTFVVFPSWVSNVEWMFLLNICGLFCIFFLFIA